MVQTEVKLNRFYRGTVVDPEGPLYIGSIRVGVANLGNPPRSWRACSSSRSSTASTICSGCWNRTENFSTEGVG